MLQRQEANTTMPSRDSISFHLWLTVPRALRGWGLRMKKILATACLAGFALAPAVHAAADDAFGLDVAAKLSTLGVGGELGYRFNDYVALRAGYNAGSLTYKDKTNPSNHFTLDLKTTPLMLDWHVFGGSFRLTGGYVNNQNQASAVETGTDVQVGGNTYNTTMRAWVCVSCSAKMQHLNAAPQNTSAISHCPSSVAYTQFSS